MKVIRQRLSHGFNSATPVASKSAVFRVTTVMPCTRAVAAIKASRSGRGLGTWSVLPRAYRQARSDE